MFDYTKTYTLLASIQGVEPIHSFLRDRYFPTNAASDIFSTDKVLMEYRDGDKKMAPFVAPRVNGVTMLRNGSNMTEYEPPMIAPKRNLSLDDLNKRGFGEALFSTETPDRRAGVLILRDMQELQNMIIRRFEKMASETILNNALTIIAYTDDKSKQQEFSINFFEGASNDAIYTPSASWATATWAQIEADIYTMVNSLTSRGLPATDLVVAGNVGSALMNNESFLKRLDIRNYNIGQIDPIELPDGAALLGRVNIRGKMINIITYDQTYTDLDGSVGNYMPSNYAFVSAPGAGRTSFAAVTQVEQYDGEFHTYTGMFIPKYMSDANANTRDITLASRPITLPNNKKPWISSKVI